jgi:hypothetical protein
LDLIAETARFGNPKPVAPLPQSRHGAAGCIIPHEALAGIPRLANLSRSAVW